MKFNAIVAIAALMASSASAWWGKGHVLLARRAEAILDEQAPEALSAAVNELLTLEGSYPSLTKDEGDHPFTECATFADNIKGMGYSWQSDWHFIDQPYLNEGGDLDDYDFEEADTDVLGALTDLTAFLKGESTEGSTYIEQIANSFPEEADQRSFALRLIIHYVGDLHQPLHATAEINDEYPEGDRGGNEEWVNPNVDGVGNLHQIWDSVVYTLTGYEDLPLTETTWSEYSDGADQLASEYPVEQSKLYSGDFQTWADESLQASIDWVYPDFTEHTAVTDEYIESREPIAKDRISYGAARLADLVADIYSTSSAESIMQADDAEIILQ